MAIIIENKEKFKQFITNKLPDDTMELIINYTLDIYKNKDHMIHYLNLRIIMLECTTFVYDLQKIILDYYTLDSIRKCVIEKSKLKQRPGVFLNICYPEGKPYCNIYENRFFMSNCLTPLETYRPEITIIKEFISIIYVRCYTNKLT